MSPATVARRLSTAVTLTCLAAILAACAPAADPGSPSMDLATAKQSTRSQQQELMAVVPAAEISTTTQTETSRALFECDANSYYWPGTMDLVLTSEADGAGLLQQIKAAWSGKEGWTVEEKTSVNGIPELVIVSREGFRHSIEFNPQRNALYTLSSSACFQMEGKPDPGTDY